MHIKHILIDEYLMEFTGRASETSINWAFLQCADCARRKSGHFFFGRRSGNMILFGMYEQCSELYNWAGLPPLIFLVLCQTDKRTTGRHATRLKRLFFGNAPTSTVLLWYGASQHKRKCAFHAGRSSALEASHSTVCPSACESTNRHIRPSWSEALSTV